MAESEQVTRNDEANRFEIRGLSGPAVLTYHEDHNHITLVHTEVPEDLEGRGYGSMLVRAALDYARTAKLRVVPACPFVRSYIDEHPEYAALTRRA